MKNRLLYLLPFLLVLIEGCAKTSIPQPVIIPQGTFTGQFTFARLLSTGVVDTSLRASLSLNMETATGFKITGDTTRHAGSYGGYVVNEPSMQIEFYDKTYPATGTAAKIHLDGVYNYTYDGTTLQLAAYGAQDTTEYYYRFTKTGN